MDEQLNNQISDDGLTNFQLYRQFENWLRKDIYYCQFKENGKRVRKNMQLVCGNYCKKHKQKTNLN